MKKTTRKGIEVLRAVKPWHPKELDEIYRRLAALIARKGSIEMQMRSSEERVETLKEILRKIQKEESELTNLLKPRTNLPSDNDGGDKKQCAVPETAKARGKEQEMVFRF